MPLAALPSPAAPPPGDAEALRLEEILLVRSYVQRQRLGEAHTVLGYGAHAACLQSFVHETARHAIENDALQHVAERRVASDTVRTCSRAAPALVRGRCWRGSRRGDEGALAGARLRACALCLISLRAGPRQWFGAGLVVGVYIAPLPPFR